ncbi:MAG: band-7 C-terminal domain-containing protein, partial [Acidobacteriota bacterium]
EGQKQETVKYSEGERIKRENEAKGEAAAILEVARATAEGIREISLAMNQPGGKDAVSMRIAVDWIESFKALAKDTNSMIIPANLTDIASITSILNNAFDFSKKKETKS